MNLKAPFFQITFVDWKSRWTSATGSASSFAATRSSSNSTSLGISIAKRDPRQCSAKRPRSHFQSSGPNAGSRSSPDASSAPNLARASTTGAYAAMTPTRLARAARSSDPANSNAVANMSGLSHTTAGTGTPRCASHFAWLAYFAFSPRLDES